MPVQGMKTKGKKISGVGKQSDPGYINRRMYSEVSRLHSEIKDLKDIVDEYFKKIDVEDVLFDYGQYIKRIIEKVCDELQNKELKEIYRSCFDDRQAGGRVALRKSIRKVHKTLHGAFDWPYRKNRKLYQELRNVSYRRQYLTMSDLQIPKEERMTNVLQEIREVLQKRIISLREDYEEKRKANQRFTRCFNKFCKALSLKNDARIKKAFSKTRDVISWEYFKSYTSYEKKALWNQLKNSVDISECMA